MTPDDRTFLGTFFRALGDRPLEPTDDPYVPLYEDDRIAEDDPVELLFRGIAWTPGQSVQLFSGFRGTGKSTELRRLRKKLREAGYLVALFDVEDYVNLSTPVDVSDFLMALAGAFGEQLKAPELLGKDPAHESYWDRFQAFLSRTRIELEEVTASAGAGAVSVDVKASLKSDPTFRKRLQKRLAGHLATLVRDVHGYLKEAVVRLKKRHGKGVDVVLLVDSVEHIRGTSINAEAVHASVETLFAGHADKLHLPNLHVVYTVPPFLKTLHGGLGALYEPGGLQVLPAVKLKDQAGARHAAGYEMLTRVVAGRGDWQRLLGDDQALERLIAHSGGHLRDLLRLIAEVARRADRLPVPARTVEAAINQIRNEFLPIADDDAAWLARVAATHRAGFQNTARLKDLARFLDTHMVLCYRNGDEWYDVHPLIAEVVRSQAAGAGGEAGGSG